MYPTRSLIALSMAARATACASPDPMGAHSAMPGMGATASAMPMADMQPRMKAMHEMHHKMMNASTPAERQALMAAHMKAMQDGMAMMKDMHGGMQGMGGMAGMGGMGDGKAMPADMARRHQMMTDHMAMMQLMMDMMKQRMPAAQ